MINLIPPDGRKIAIREYWVHMFSAWAFLLSGIFVVAILLLIPSYVLVESQLAAVEGNNQKLRVAEDAFRMAEDDITTANAAIVQLSRQSEHIALSRIIESILGEVSGGITLRRFDIERSDNGIQPIQVQGRAATREALADFRSSLEDLALFESATVPISDLAREADLPFVVTILLVEAER